MNTLRKVFWYVDSFPMNVPFLYLLRISANQRFPDVFKGIQKVEGLADVPQNNCS